MVPGMGVHKYKGVGVRFADFNAYSVRPNYFNFIGYLIAGKGIRHCNALPITY